MSVSCECCVFSGRGLCVGLVTLPEESYRVRCVPSRSLGNEEVLTLYGMLGQGKKRRAAFRKIQGHSKRRYSFTGL
jgi:hypothetical protein